MEDKEYEARLDVSYFSIPDCIDTTCRNVYEL
jgi:hypothetical protein